MKQGLSFKHYIFIYILSLIATGQYYIFDGKTSIKNLDYMWLFLTPLVITIAIDIIFSKIKEQRQLREEEENRKLELMNEEKKTNKREKGRNRNFKRNKKPSY